MAAQCGGGEDVYDHGFMTKHTTLGLGLGVGLVIVCVPVMFVSVTEFGEL